MPSRTATAGTLPAEAAAAPAHLQLPPLPDIDVGSRIPGLRTSAVFFSSLRANLRLSEYSSSPLPSPRQAPLGFPGNAKTSANDSQRDRVPLAPPSPLLLSTVGAQDEVDCDAKPRLQFLSPPAVPCNKSLSQSRAKSRLSSPAEAAGQDEYLHTPSEPRLYWTSSPQDTSAALSLLASTVEEQRKTALRSLLTHPVNILLFVTLLAIVHKSVSCTMAVYSARKTHRGTVNGSGPVAAQAATTSCLAIAVAAISLTLVSLAAAFALVSPYSRLARRIAAYGSVQGRGDKPTRDVSMPAETIADPWFKPGRDEILVAVAGGPQAPLPHDSSATQDTASTQTDAASTIVGVLIMQWAPSGVSGSKVGKRRRPSGGRSCIKAWATSPGWRGRGIGAALLAEAARVTIKDRGGDSASFAEMHAHAERVLPELYNSAFERRDRWAGLALSGVVAAKPWMNLRRR